MMMIASCHLPVSFLYLPIFGRRRTDLHQDKTTRIRVLLSYSTSRWSKSQGIKETRLRCGACQCALHANASRIVTRKEEEKRLPIIGPTWISKNHVSNHTTYSHCFNGQRIDQNHRTCEMVPRLKLTTDFHLSGLKLLQTNI